MSLVLGSIQRNVLLGAQQLCGVLDKGFLLRCKICLMLVELKLPECSEGPLEGYHQRWINCRVYNSA